MGVYRPPSGNVNDFTDSINSILRHDKILSGYIVLIAGDMNLNLLDLDSQETCNYLFSLNSKLFLPAITNPTRFSSDLDNSRPSCLDHIFTNKFDNLDSGIINFDFTDHNPTFIHLHDISLKLPNPLTKITIRPFSQEKMNVFLHKVSLIDWESEITWVDVNRSFVEFSETLNSLYCRCFPLHTKYLSQKRMKNKWVTQSVKHLIDEKSRVFKLFKQGIISASVNKQLKKDLNKSINKAKKQYHLSLFNNCRKNMRKSWEIINDLMCRTVKRDRIKSLVVDGKIFEADHEIAEEFNRYFSNIAIQLERNLPSVSPSSSRVAVNENSFFLRPMCEDECISIISGLKLTKTSLNEIPVRLFKQISRYIAKPLCKLINFSFTTGVFPSSLKSSRITQVFKSGERSDPGNYRPIANIPFLSKIIEKSLGSRLLSYFNKFSIIYKNQFGFLQGKSTADALIHLTELIYKSLNRNEYQISVFLDLKKAFDTVSHSLLLKKLETYGVRGLQLSLFESFLSDRSQYVRYGTSDSSLRPTPFGVPQGSNLGPILFLVYVNDIHLATQTSSTVLFADDTTLLNSYFDFSTLISNFNSDLNNVMNWTLTNRLTLNVQKTNAINFSNRQLPETAANCLTINNRQINLVNTVKYLGVQFDSNLKFTEHIKVMSGKLARNTGILYKIRENLPMTARLNYYYGFIFPYLNYNIIIWGGTYSNHLNCLNIQHKRTIRTLAGLDYLDHTSQTFKSLRILKLFDLYRYNLCIYMFKNRGNPDFWPSHSHNTRNRENATLTFNRLTVTQRSVYYMGPKCWNELPIELRNECMLGTFKRKLRSHYLQTY